MTWKKMKKYLLAVQEELQERNGIPHCSKNCGMDYGELVEEIEGIFKEKI